MDDKRRKTIEGMAELERQHKRLLKWFYWIVIALIAYVVLVDEPKIAPQGYEPDESSQHIRCGTNDC